MLKRLLSWFGLDRRLRQLRIAAGEGALAAEDRAQLLRMAWDAEKQRFKWMLLLVIAAVGLTTVAVAMLSLALVVHFWDTPYRVTAAWVVAGVWIALWAAAVVALLSTLRSTADGFAPARAEFGRDWAWAQHRFGFGLRSNAGANAPPPPRPATAAELQARIARQRERVAVLQTPDEELPPTETLSAQALRLSREHPVAVGVAATAVVAVLGPRRLLRWTLVLVPTLWRLRR